MGSETALSLWELSILAIVQGITEFLPISSTGHLAIAREVFGLQAENSVMLDIALHLGSLLAVLLYFWRDIRSAFVGPFCLVADLSRGDPLRFQSRLAILLLIATIPAIVVGLIMSATGWDESVRTLEVVGWTTIIFGILLWVSDRFADRGRSLHDWRYSEAVMMGVAQAIALLPGTSRSGITMTAARFLGFSRVEAARVSMLMAIPVILAASAKLFYDLAKFGDVALGLDIAVAALLAFLAAYAALAVMMRMLVTTSFTPFVIYRLLLGAVLLWLAYQ
ncbi:MAG: undecaprenyl-diphosphate phosphatase [Neomegalonema sp.]|nr:undecaprenyl-diphosphate phosphatase [Neomegalonema sp.]